MSDRQRVWIGAEAWGLAAPFLLFAFAACSSSDDERGFLTSQGSPIISGAPAPDRSGIVHVAHRDLSITCSGTLIAPALVVTAKHCAFWRSPSGDVPLPVDGFRVGFGPEVQQLAEHGVQELRWIGMPGELGVEAAVARGEDVALLVLAELAPTGSAPTALMLDYVPRAGDRLTVVGFGVSDLATGAAGVRREAEVDPRGFDPATGLVEVDGAQTCYGDSGGPLLFGPDEALVGILGQVGGSEDGGFCDVGLSFASTVASLRVRALVVDACEVADGCVFAVPPERATGDGGASNGGNPDAGERLPQDASSGTRDARDGLIEIPVEAGDGVQPVGGSGAGCMLTRTIPGRAPHGQACVLLLFALGLVRGQMRRRSRTGQGLTDGEV